MWFVDGSKRGQHIFDPSNRVATGLCVWTVQIKFLNFWTTWMVQNGAVNAVPLKKKCMWNGSEKSDRSKEFHQSGTWKDSNQIKSNGPAAQSAQRHWAARSTYMRKLVKDHVPKKQSNLVRKCKLHCDNAQPYVVPNQIWRWEDK